MGVAMRFAGMTLMRIFKRSISDLTNQGDQLAAVERRLRLSLLGLLRIHASRNGLKHGKPQKPTSHCS